MGEDEFIKESGKEHTPFALKITYNVIKTTEDVSAREIAKILEKNKVGALVVEKEGKLAGIISERDIVWRVIAQDKSLDQTKAKDIMTTDVITFDLNEGMDKLYELMKKVPFRHLPVRRGEKIVGMISNRDLMYLRNLKTVE